MSRHAGAPRHIVRNMVCLLLSLSSICSLSLCYEDFDVISGGKHDERTYT